MKGDFSRVTFDVANHFSRVLMQQGRVTIDADPNEQAAILLHYVRTLARDLIGAYGGPADNDLGFKLDVLPATKNPPAPPALSIGPGRYYVDGILCENERACSYASQPDYPLPQSDSLPAELGRSNPSTTVFWLYLDVWERHITPVEDDRMREVALGGPDTCTRAKVIWQVKALSQDALTALGIGSSANDRDCTTPLGALTKISSGQMAAGVDPGKQIKDPCVVAPDARYRGAENQLYRVEVHRGGTIDTVNGEVVKKADGPTFKWSRDNGSVATAWLGTEGNDLLVASARGFSPGTWVELSDDAQELHGAPGALVKLSSVDGNRLRVDPGSVPPAVSLAWTTSLRNPKVRRWNQTENDDIVLADGAIPIPTDTSWIDLEDGVRVQFGPAASPRSSSTRQYRTGDYWLIPARVATGDIEWPRTGSTADFLPPRGVEHHHAPLGWLTWDGAKWTVTSCLCTLSPLARPEPDLKRSVAAPTSPTLPLPPPSSAPAATSPTLPLPPPSTSPSQPSERKS
jgi:uncharacterized protein DUF6519